MIMMSDAERMMLEDAMEQAIESERKNIKLKRVIVFLLFVCLGLLVFTLR